MANSDEMDDVIDEEDKLAMDVRARMRGVPTNFGGQDRQLVHLPTDEEAKLFSQTRVRTCAGCKHFRKEYFGDRPNTVNKFVATLIHDYEWRKEFLGDDPKNMGLCGAKDDVLVGPSSLACESYRPK